MAISASPSPLRGLGHSHNTSVGWRPRLSAAAAARLNQSSLRLESLTEAHYFQQHLASLTSTNRLADLCRDQWAGPVAHGLQSDSLPGSKTPLTNVRYFV